MDKYKNLSGRSGVLSYELGHDYVLVEFKSGYQRFYKYTVPSTGLGNIERMKILAQQGTGLNSYIGLNIKSNYESKW